MTWWSILSYFVVFWIVIRILSLVWMLCSICWRVPEEREVQEIIASSMSICIVNSWAINTEVIRIQEMTAAIGVLLILYERRTPICTPVHAGVFSLLRMFFLLIVQRNRRTHEWKIIKWIHLLTSNRKLVIIKIWEWVVFGHFIYAARLKEILIICATFVKQGVNVIKLISIKIKYSDRGFYRWRFFTRSNDVQAYLPTPGMLKNILYTIHGTKSLSRVFY